MGAVSILRKRSETETAAESSLIKRIHWRMIPILGIFYGLVFLNRQNLATSHKLWNAERDAIPALDVKVYKVLSPNDVKKLGAIFQAGYIPPAFISNIFLLHFEPKIWLIIVMGMTGIFGLFSGVPNGFAGVASMRFFLGLFSGAFFPGAIYLMSRWYRRDYLGFPVAVFFAGSAVLSAFGNIIAAGIVRIEGGREGWQWVSIIEGIMTCVLAGIALLLPNPLEIGDHSETLDSENEGNKSEEDNSRPLSSIAVSRSSVVLPTMNNQDQNGDFAGPTARKKFFSSEEKATFDNWITRDTTEDTGEWMGDTWRGVPEHRRREGYWIKALKDEKTYMFVLMRITCILPRDIVVNLLPDIVQGLGVPNNNNSTNGLLLLVPPYALAFIFNMFTGWLSDVTRQRGWMNVFSSCLTIIGGIILVSSEDYLTQYIALCIVFLGAYSGAANGLTWICNNFEGYSKRAIVLGISVGCNHVTWFMVQSDKVSIGKIRQGMIVGFGTLGLIISYLLHLYLKKQNVNKILAKRDGRYTKWDPNSSLPEDEGDLSPEFLYYD